MEITKQLITPSAAQKYLESNIHNRSIKRTVVDKYAKDMIDGRWKQDTAESIKISETGVILDGQHRLLAIVKANVPVYLHVATGLSDSVFDVLDTGKIRTAVDVFKVKSIRFSNSVPSIVSSYIALKAGHSSAKSLSIVPTSTILLDMYYGREAFWQAVATKSHTWYLAFAKIMTPSSIGSFYALFYDIHEKDAESFFKQLATGQNITNNTIMILRNKLMADKLSTRKMNIALKNALIIKAWNSFRAGRVMRAISFDPIKEEFPKAI